ncbi:MAG TPA: NADPH-dependent FMN reductase [Polyangiaceae bacterium]
MANIIAISGSLRKASYNTALARAAAELMPPSSRLELASIGGIPVYDGDVEAQGLPPAVTALKERLVAADGWLLVTPEYNNSVPGSLKNAIDWLSRPSSDIPRVFGNRPVGVIGATPGSGGTRLAQTAWLPVFRTLGMLPFFEKVLYVASAAKVFDEEGRLTDERVKTQLTAYVRAFVAFVERAASKEP